MKKAIGFALLGTLAISGAANAGITNNLLDPTATNYQSSDLVVFVSNSADPNNFYARDLGVTMAQLLSVSDAAKKTGSVVTAGVNLNFAADANLTSFLGTHTGGTNTFYILGGTPGTPGTPSLGSEAYALVSTAKPGASTTASNQELDSTTFSSMYTFFDAVNTALGASASGIIGVGVGDASLGAAAASLWTAAASTGVALGSTAGQLYAFATSGTTPGNLANVLSFGSYNMSTLGNLSFSQAAVPAVPLPAAIWLFGSGLLGMAGVGRRRAA